MSLELKQLQKGDHAHGCAQCRAEWFRAAALDALLWRTRAAITSTCFCGACGAAWRVEWLPDAEGGMVIFRPVSGHHGRLS